VTERKLNNQQIESLAQQLVLRMLVSKEKMENPKFEEQAQKWMDEFLGSHVTDANDEPDRDYVEVRARFMSILRSRDDIFIDEFAGEKPMTWKRRFFLWLERG
jgi:hypothetical protein